MSVPNTKHCFIITIKVFPENYHLMHSFTVTHLNLALRFSESFNTCLYLGFFKIVFIEKERGDREKKIPAALLYHSAGGGLGT